MFKSKKGNAYVIGLITVTIMVIFLANILFPQVRNTTQSQNYQESFTYDPRNDTANVSFSLDKTNLDVLTISGLTEDTNFTVDYDAGTVTILANTTANATYTASYTYFEANYLDNATERTLMAIVILAGIIGALYYIFTIFGVA